MNFIVENWYIILAFMCLGAIIGVKTYDFISLPNEEQKEKVRCWLLGMVIEAEKQYGSGTGKLKLSWVYDKFLTKFTWLATVITFEQFSNLVDSALIQMRSILAQNSAVQTYVGDSSEIDRLKTN